MKTLEAGNVMRGVANNTTNITTAQMTIQRIPVLTPPLPHDSSTRLILQSLQNFTSAQSAMGKPHRRLKFEETSEAPAAGPNELGTALGSSDQYCQCVGYSSIARPVSALIQETPFLRQAKTSACTSSEVITASRRSRSLGISDMLSMRCHIV